MLLVQTVELLDVLRLTFDIKSLRRGGLHAVGQLEALDACIEFALDRRFGERAAVQFRQQVELGTLALWRERGWHREVINRCALRLQPGALIDARQETRAPIGRAAFGQAAIQRITHHDEGRQRITLAAEPIVDP